MEGKGKKWGVITSKVGEKTISRSTMEWIFVASMSLFHPHPFPSSPMKRNTSSHILLYVVLLFGALLQVPGYPLLTVARWQSVRQGSTPTPNANAVGHVCSLLLFNVQCFVVFVPNILLSPSATYQPCLSFPSHLNTFLTFPSSLARSNHGFFSHAQTSSTVVVGFLQGTGLRRVVVILFTLEGESMVK